jgi:hypothetical protein
MNLFIWTPYTLRTNAKERGGARLPNLRDVPVAQLISTENISQKLNTHFNELEVRKAGSPRS